MLLANEATFFVLKRIFHVNYIIRAVLYALLKKAAKVQGVLVSNEHIIH